MTSYSIQTRPKPQNLSKICPVDCFWRVPVIVLEGSSQGDWNLSKVCQHLKMTISRQILTNLFSPILPGTLKNNRRDKFWTHLGFGRFEWHKGSEGLQGLGVFFCVRLELLCSQLELFAYSWSFLLTVGVFCLQWESASHKHLNALQAKKLNCKQKKLQLRSQAWKYEKKRPE